MIGTRSLHRPRHENGSNPNLILRNHHDHHDHHNHQPTTTTTTTATTTTTTITTTKLTTTGSPQQSADTVYISIMAKGLDKDAVSVDFGERDVCVDIKIDGSRTWSLDLNLCDDIVPDACKFSVGKVKTEVKLKKKNAVRSAHHPHFQYGNHPHHHPVNIKMHPRALFHKHNHPPRALSQREPRCFTAAPAPLCVPSVLYVILCMPNPCCYICHVSFTQPVCNKYHYF